MSQTTLTGFAEVAQPDTHGDVQYTPQALADTLVRLLPRRDLATVLEPHAGGGAFVRALQRIGAHVVAFDVDPTAQGLIDANAEDTCDFLDVEPSDLGRGMYFDAVVGNPPFSNAEEHIRHALDVSGRHVAFLLRVGFLCSARRVEFWLENPCANVWPIAQRPKEWQAAYDYAFFHWDLEHTGSTILHPPVSWR
jgi:predicted RNA methylase